jgi:hypothetical protein
MRAGGLSAGAVELCRDKEKAWAPIARRAGPGAGAVKTGNLRDSSSLVPFACSFECRLAIFVGKRPAQVLKTGAFRPPEGHNAGAMKTSSERSPGQ